MPYCDEYVELISAAVDGALSQEETARLEAHLAQCPECKALYEDFAAIHSALGEVPPVTLPPIPAYMEQVIAAMDHQMDLREAKEAAKAKHRRYWQRGMAAAAVLAVVLVGRAGFSGWELPAQHNETQAVTARGAANIPALSEEGLEDKAAQPDEEQIALQSEVAPTAEPGEVKQEETPVLRSTAGDAPEPSQPQDKMAKVASTPAPVQGPMTRSMSVPAGDGGANEMDDTVAETADADVIQAPAAQSFMVSLPLPSETPEEPQQEELSQSNSLMVTSAEMDQESEAVTPVETEEVIPSLSQEELAAMKRVVEYIDLPDTYTWDTPCTIVWGRPEEPPEDSPDASTALTFDGLSENGQYYLFSLRLRIYGWDPDPDAWHHSIFVDNYAVPVNGGEIASGAGEWFESLINE